MSAFDLRDFLANFRPGPVTLVAIVPDGPTSAATFEDPERAALWAERQNARGRNLYFTANGTRPDQSRKPTKADITAIWCAHADLDPRDRDHPRDQERARLRALAAELDASVIIDSGNGIQPLWFLESPLDPTPEHVQMIEGFNQRIEAALGGSGTWNVDRLLRLPGTTNHPNAKKRALGRGEAQARILAAPWHRHPSWFALRDLADRLEADPPAHATPRPRPPRPNGQAAEPGTPAADLPDPEITALIAEYPFLRAVWDKTAKTPPPDQSQSGWDHHLAAQLARLGFDRERIAATVRAYRLHHDPADKKAARADYIWRTADAAMAANSPGTAPGQRALICDPADPVPTARKFVELHHTEAGLRTLHHHRGTFYRWTGRAYAETPPADVRAALYAMLEKALRPGAKGGVLPFMPNAAKVADVLDALKAVAHLRADIEPPCWLDGRDGPPPGELLACANALLHLPTRELIPHTPALLAHNALDFAYDPAAPEPTAWLTFLRSLWHDDPEAISCLQEIFGCLLTPDTRLHKIILIVGPMRSGKGTIGRVVKALLGSANVAGPTLASLSTNFGLQPLINRPLAIISDARLSSRADQAVIAERLLSISGEDGLTVDRKYLGAWTGTLPTRFLILTNELPRLADASGALASRFIVLTMQQSFLGREDHGLIGRLLGELTGILNWAIAGYLRQRSLDRIVSPASSDERVRELYDLSSLIGAFARERCIVAPGQSVTANVLYLAWKNWCAEQGRDHPGTKQTFGRDLHAAFPHLKVTQPRSGEPGRPRWYEGIGIA